MTAPRREPPPVSVLTARVLRDVMGRFATGVTVVTVDGEKAHGMTANAFTSVSLDPPMVLCCVAHTARLYPAALDARRFGVSVLGADQVGLARYFTNKSRPEGMAQFDRVDWFPGRHTGVPLLSGSIAWVECELTEVYDGGDHAIFLGTVLSAGSGAGEPLVFAGGSFHHLDQAVMRSA